MGNNINVILGSKGKCCLCSNTPHCGDCDEEEPPPGSICDCNVCGLFNIPAACQEKAEELYGACGKCTNVGPCESVCGSGKGTQGCYNPEPVDCSDLGCFNCEPPPEPPTDPCIKIVDDECFCEDIGLTCCSYADKTCTDFNFNYYSDTLSAELGCAGIDCYKEVAVECKTLTCYECKTCDDFGYSDDPDLECEVGEIKTTVTPCGERLTCYYCAPDNCDCSDYGYFDTCKEARDSLGNCGECETQSPFPKGSACEFKVCYRPFCTTCGFLGFNTCKFEETNCPKTQCYVVKEIEDFSDCDPPCTKNSPPCCSCDLTPCSEFAPCDDITYVENPNDCPIPLTGKFASTPCDKELKEEGKECYRCCEDACPISGNYCGILTAPCGAQQPAGSSSVKFYAFNGPQCEAVTIKINYSMGFTPDACSFTCLVACGGLQNLGTTGCASGNGSKNFTIPKDAISITSSCTYNCSGLDSNGDGKLNTSSIDAFSISCVP